MSKIFEGLKKTEGAIAKLTIDAIGGDPAAGPAAENGSAPEANRGDQQAVRRSIGAPARRAESGLSLEGASESVRTLSDVTRLEAPAQLESLDQKTLAPEHPFHSGLDTAELPRPGDAALESPPSSRVESAPPESGPGSVAIRLRAGYPLLPFDSGEADVAADEYRRIRTKLLQHQQEPRLMLVSSPSAGDGKSITALNIAGALALNRDARVLLVDVDLRRPTIAGLLGVPELAGVADVLTGSCRLEDAVVRLAPFPNLFLLPAGTDRRNPSELLSSPRWKALCDEFRSQMTYVVLDGPPVEAVAEYSLLEELSDGLILVVRTDHTVRSLLYQALKSIPPERILGTVVNSYRESFFWKQRGDYYS